MASINLKLTRLAGKSALILAAAGSRVSSSVSKVECDRRAEIKGLGGGALSNTNCAERGARQAPDFLLELAFDLPKYARLAPYAFRGQLPDLYRGREI